MKDSFHLGQGGGTRFGCSVPGADRGPGEGVQCLFTFILSSKDWLRASLEVGNRSSCFCKTQGSSSAPWGPGDKVELCLEGPQHHLSLEYREGKRRGWLAPMGIVVLERVSEHQLKGQHEACSPEWLGGSSGEARVEKGDRLCLSPW